MKLLEYNVKEIFDQFAIPTMPGCVVDDTGSIEETLAKSGVSYPVVVKAQVPIGGRGKAGGIRFADTPEEAAAHCRDLLGSVLRGYVVHQLLIVEKARDIQQELYLSVLMDRASKCPMIIFSPQGGMEIEETAKNYPDAIQKVTVDPLIGLQDYTATYLLSKGGMDIQLRKPFTLLLKKLYQAFCRCDCMLLEINPLILDSKGNFTALDGKGEIDDSSLYRHPDILALRDAMQEEPLVREARSYDFLYIPIEKGGSIAVASNGSGMLMSCIDLISKEGLSVGAAIDLGGGATAQRIKEAMRILFSTPGIKAVLINIFGGITRCDEVALGVKLLLESGLQDTPEDSGKTVILRMEGTNKETGLEIIRRLPGDIVSVPGLRESVKALTDRREKL